jgi:hypothetical protein
LLCPKTVGFLALSSIEIIIWGVYITNEEFDVSDLAVAMWHSH